MKRVSKKGFASYAGCDALTSSDIYFTLNHGTKLLPVLGTRREILSNYLQKVMLSFFSLSWVFELTYHHLAKLTRLASTIAIYWLGACFKFWNVLFFNGEFAAA
jgi:hypothetical protein